MSELEERTEAVNDLLGLDLKLTHFKSAVPLKDKAGTEYWSYCIPWMLTNEDKDLLGRCNFNKVSGFLSALEWLGAKTIIKVQVIE